MNRYAVNRTDYPSGMRELWVIARDEAHVRALIYENATGIRDATALEWSAATITLLAEDDTNCKAGVMIGSYKATTAGLRD